MNFQFLPFVPDKNWSAICPKCKTDFSLGKQGYSKKGDIPYYVIDKSAYYPYTETREDAITFPQGDLTKIDATCPLCDQRFTFDYSDLYKPNVIIEAEMRQNKVREKSEDLQKRVLELESQVQELKADKQMLTEQVRDKDVQIGKFAEGYMTLAKLVNERTGPNETDESTRARQNPLAR